jgi:hypothetical protein
MRFILGFHLRSEFNFLVKILSFKDIGRFYRQLVKQAQLNIEDSSYLRKYKKLRIKVPTFVELHHKLQPASRQSKDKPDLLILSIYHDYNWEGINLGPSLKKFGEVVHIDWMDPSITFGVKHGEKRWFEAFNQSLFQFVQKRLQGRKPDVIFAYLSHEQITLSTLKQLRSLEAPILNLSLNDKEHFVGKFRNGRHGGVRDICSGFDLCWTSTDDALIKYCVEGAVPIYLPEGANPSIHKPYADEQFIHDVGFVGQCYGNRPFIIEKLRSIGFDAVAFGPGWPSGPLSAEEMIRTWSRCRVNLGFAGVADYKNTFCLKGRDFELPMSGGLYLTEHNNELPPFYEIGKEILTWKNFDDLVEKIQWVLSNPTEADSIRQLGRTRALREHSWEMRFQKAFEALGVLKPSTLPKKSF